MVRNATVPGSDSEPDPAHVCTLAGFTRTAGSSTSEPEQDAHECDVGTPGRCVAGTPERTPDCPDQSHETGPERR